MNLLISGVAVALGAFIAAFPSQAATIWGSEKLDKLAPAQKTAFVRTFRAFGILLCLGGILFAVDTFGFSNYHR